MYQDSEAIHLLKRLAKDRDAKAWWFSYSILNRQYAILLIYMYRFVFRKVIRVEENGSVGVAFLVDQTIKQLEHFIHKGEGQEYILMFEELTSFATHEVFEKLDFLYFSKDRGKEMQIRRTAYLYNLAWLVLDGSISQERCEKLICSKE